MKCLFKHRYLLFSNSGNKFVCIHFLNNQAFYLSTRSNPVELHNNKTNEMKKETDLSSLFDEIADILGGETINLNKNAPGFPIFNTKLENLDLKEESSVCPTGVCENANDNGVEEENLNPSADTKIGKLTEAEISLTVQKLSEIVWNNNDVVSMEELLAKEEFELNMEIVDKVLKRFSKLPQLAFRVFNWVKHKNGFVHTIETYNTMMNIIAESKEFQLVEELVEDMRKNSCEMDIRTWTIIISHYGKAKMIGKALLAYQKMRESGIEPDLVAYKLMLRALCNAGKADIAVEFYREMMHKEMGLDMSLYKLLLKCLAGTGERANVDLVVDDMIRVSQIPTNLAYATALKSFCISGKIRDALEMVRDLRDKDVPLDTEIVEILVQGLCKADRITDALEIVDIMKKKDVVNEKIYGIIINGYLRGNNIPKALELFCSIKDSGYLPTITTYTNLLQHLLGLNEFHKASELYNEMLEKGLELDCLAITSMVAGLVRQKRISEAWNVFKSMEEKGVRATPKCYTIYIKELCKVSMTDEIIKVLKETKTSKVCIDRDTYKGIISYLERRGEMEIIEKVKRMEITSKTFPQEGEEFTADVSTRMEPSMDLNSCQTGEMSLVPQVMESPSSSYRDQELLDVCQILSSSQEWFLKQECLEKCTVHFTPELVVEILRNCSLHSGAALHFFSWVEKQAGYNHTTETYNMAIKISGSAKDFTHMRSLAFEMRRKGCLMTQETWTIMIMQYGRIGLTDIALRNFRDMKASGFDPAGSTYKFLIISFCGTKGRKVDEAIQLFEEMIRTGCIPDKELVEIYLGTLCEAGKLLNSKKCVESLCKSGFTVPLAYSLYIRALSRAGKLEEALTVLDEIGQEHHTLYQYTYGSLVHGLLRKGRLEEALAKIESMKQVGVHPTVHVYTSLIVYFFREKQIAKALEMVRQMNDEGCEPTIVTYSALIRGYMTMGKLADAWDVFHRMKLNGPHPDFKTYSMFISCLCKVGKSEEGLELISEMVASGMVPSTVNFRTVNFGLNREGKQDLARTVLHMKSDVNGRRKFMT